MNIVTIEIIQKQSENSCSNYKLWSVISFVRLRLTLVEIFAYNYHLRNRFWSCGISTCYHYLLSVIHYLPYCIWMVNIKWRIQTIEASLQWNKFSRINESIIWCRLGGRLNFPECQDAFGIEINFQPSWCGLTSWAVYLHVNWIDFHPMSAETSTTSNAR